MTRRVPDDIARIIADAVAEGVVPLQGYAIEKDFHVLDAMRMLSEAPKNGLFKLVFCGGTCLSKARGLLDRMSEDVDFKVVPTAEAEALPRNALRRELGAYADSLSGALANGGFGADSVARESRDNNTSTKLEVGYDSAFTPLAALRPRLLIELNLSRPEDATETLRVGYLLERLLDGEYGDSSFRVECVSLRESLAEKLVSFPRRLALHLAGSDDPEATLLDPMLWDKALVRHLYDVSRIVAASPETTRDRAEVERLVRGVMAKDGADFRNRHAAFAEDPVGEALGALEYARTSAALSDQYARFMEDMVYADGAGRPSFDDALRAFGNELLPALGVNDTPRPADAPAKAKAPTRGAPKMGL